MTARETRETRTVQVVLDGVPVQVPAAVSVAAALALRGRIVLRTSRPSGAPRAVFCGMGACHECAVTVDGVAGTRACITPVAAGMRIDTEGEEPR
ncbi:2Fe-2S iron-sulfur cluster-binding protein [Actinomadura xylanilytica]|uniref:2Fe-2S iron-sulfur cluster-binding protein n=1 Tax=Actinomadura xylanilytica TaxID=887459 RepID=UPI00255AAE95|nr:2Fe-2S iron-sulfur cluster-binding protein [Actinomadura xylanilytica]MDL4775430.1 2Fe-2S iron-sulfur cluster-binding protein [Actinomadura xylanilytica]